MQIQCPHCKSRYRLGAEMVDAYGGFVRCGNCNYKFNIHDQVILDEIPHDLVNTEVRPAQQKDDRYKGRKSGSDSQATRIEPRLERDEAEDEFNIRFGHGEDDEEGGDSSEPVDARGPRLEPAMQSVELEPIEDFQFPENLDEMDDETGADDNESEGDLTAGYFEQDSADEVLQAAESRQWPELDMAEEPVLFDSLNDDDAEEDSVHLPLINDDEEEDADSGFFKSLFSMLWRAVLFLFWAAAAIALAYLLFGQIKETLYPAYKNHSLVQQIRSGMCAYLPCERARYDKGLFEIVVSRMDEITQPSRQLHVSIFLLNNAQNAQVYPNILLALKTIDGSTVGQRVFTPGEYFTSYDSLISSNAAAPAAKGALIKPNKLGKILIKLDNPPANAVGFEARVVE